jgi:hypothetical protein
MRTLSPDKPSILGWWTRRREPIHDHRAFPQSPATPLPVGIYPQKAPEPVPYTAFFNVGRDAEHIGMERQQPPMSLAPVDWLSVIGWPFLPGMKANPTSLITPYNRGRLNPQPTRVNIESPQQTTLGMRTAVRPPLVIGPSLMKLV